MASNEKLITFILKLNNQMSKGLKEASGSFQKMGKSMTNAGQKMTVGLTLPIVGLGAAAVKTAVEFESAFAGVIKTVDGTTEELAQLRKELENLATGDSPVAALENAQVALFEIAEAAGQLGVARKDVVKFTETLAALSMATDIVGDEGARSLAQFANVTNFDLGNIDKLGDVIVELGNNLATTENQILTFGKRMGRLANVGFKPEEILAFGGAMASIGIEAEAGASAFTKGATQIAVAAAQGGKGLDSMAQVAGKTSEAMADLVENNPAQAMQQFIEGLGDLSLDQQVAALDDLGIRGGRAQAAFLGLAGDTEGLAAALDLAGGAIGGNGALMKEAGLRAATTAGEMNKFKNNLSQLANDFGVIILPKFNALLVVLSKVVKWFSGLSEGTKTIIVTVLGIIAALGPLLMIFGALAGAVSSISAALPILAGAFAVITAPVGIVIALIAALIAAFWLLANNWQQIMGLISVTGEMFKAVFSGITDWLASWIPELGDLFRLIGEKIKSGLANFGNAFKEVSANLRGFEAKAVSVVKSIASAIIGAFKQLPNALAMIGKAIMQGLIDGVKGMITSFVNVVKGLANKTVNAVKNAFQIRSPSKVMAKMGGQVVAGFNEGIEGMGGIGVDVPSLSAGATAGGALASSGAMTAGNGVTINIQNLNVPQGTTREQVDAIVLEIGKRAKKFGGSSIR